ncbi:hypothetical protein [Sedimentibacter sp.]|uniref:hypothetical protein n=1 Tax=Sedimentibacter sp. TaxID=1960295 RepID=UPI0028A839D4|nr:hypothetical protein [Sedimentibacter sp.]
MTAMLTFFSTILLICSFLGYMLLTQKVIGIRQEFVPVFVFSSVACIIYFCGLAGILFAGSVVIMVGGLIAFGIILAKRLHSESHFKIRLSLFGFFWLAGNLFFFSLLLRSELTHYDNFSHWAIVVKQMLSTDAFPTSSSDLIDFKNYPLGISSFIYYVCRFAGNYQQVMILAQGILIFSCFYAIFGIITEKKRFLLYAFLGLGCSSLSFFNITIRINNLLVDFLLPIYTLAIFAVSYRYRRDHKRAFTGALPMAALLSITKSTGIIFTVIGLVFLFYMIFIHDSYTSRGRKLLLVLITFLIVILPYLSWSWHMETAFSDVENKFDFQNMPEEKTVEQIQEISYLFISSSTDISTRPAMGILVFNLAAAGAIIFDFLVLKKKWKLWKALIALDVVLILYYAGILGLYVFSMPLDEALWLAGFERYASSIVVLFAGGLVMTAAVDIENSFYYRIGQVPDEQAFRSVASKNRYQKGVLACMAIAVTLLLSEYNGILSVVRTYDNSLPYKIRTITGDRWYKNGEEDSKRYLFYAPDRDSQVTNFYMQYVGRYYLYCPNVDGICLFYEDNMDNLLSSYDYLVVAEGDANERYLLRKHYGVSGKEGIYRIESTDGQIELIFEESEEK